MHNPVSTYRIQFNKEFTFSMFKEIIPYLHDLGVKTIYASPIFEASPGSMHGYDTVNPLRINPEIGTEAQLLSISKTLTSKGMSWIQDIVPNHMAYHENNKWLMDVLEKGLESAYFNYFDINWSGDKSERIMAPFLGSELREVVENGELKIVKAGNIFKLDYFGARYPLNAAAQKVIQTEDPDQINRDTKKLLQLADTQHYRLCHWKETDKRINYRRFFTVNSLICLNIQHKDVFRAYHKYILSLLSKGVFQGLRVDHIDGLFDPSAYLDMLRELAGPEVYLVVEKILEEGEEMSVEWPIQGATGYEFLATVNNLLTNKGAEHDFSRFYERLTANTDPIPQQIYQKKRAILEEHMAGELDNLLELFFKLKLADDEILKDIEPPLLKRTFAALLINCPVYRYYGRHFPLCGREEKELKGLLDSVEQKELSPAIKVLKQVWLKASHEAVRERDYNARAELFYKRFMQFSGPLMAKGVEDTLMYTYNRFIGKNEVGDSPEGFGKTPEEYHEQMLQRQRCWPLGLNGSSTHDTKRGEDVRARLQVLTDLHAEWLGQVKRWSQLNQVMNPKAKLDDNDKYFIYQTLIGSHPMPGVADETYAGRLAAYLEKALREAKVKTGWAAPNTAYEAQAKQFALALLDKNGSFWPEFSDFQQKVSDYGILNSLSQVALKFTSPGVPDVYQGTELWDLSLVDPDNRRPVDYGQRNSWLKDFSPEQRLSDFWRDRYSGKIKLWLEQLLLKKAHAFDFSAAGYIPVKVKGHYAEHLLAFARRNGAVWILTVIPLHLAALAESADVAIQHFDWRNTRLLIPQEAPGNWQNLLDKEEGTHAGKIRIKDLFKHFPLAVLEMKQEESPRGSGILMHLSSIPSSFGIGDMGPQAMEFIDALARSNQKYWQLLPLNPITCQQSFSPYSSISSMAGNVLFISPQLLEKEGLLSSKTLKNYLTGIHSNINYAEVEQQKTALLDEAYHCFKAKKQQPLLEEFLAFCKQEADWLEDFVQFSVLRAAHGQRPWNEWPVEFRKRQSAALHKFLERHKAEINKEKWLQFIFCRQWNALKVYARQQEIQFIGDLPFYISYDSADVWANPSLFDLDAVGNRITVAGVPPDYFNAEGQLWGMPVYNWKLMKNDQFSWWKKRLKKNIEMYDLLRLDHFRAFSSYWAVSVKETTAINGQWMPGPGAAFFEVMKAEFGGLPFIAEDLGEIDAAVYALRDQFELPGMKVLQFAFGKDMARSIHIPHAFENDNAIAYTGTHDNNTTKGWFTEKSTKLSRRNMAAYLGMRVNKKNVADQLIRLAFSSTARLAIIPLQDVLGLGGSARMNVPSSTKDNWGWRLQEAEFTKKHEKRLRKLTRMFGRY